MDNYYLNNALLDYDDYLKITSNPEFDVQIEFTLMKQHWENYSLRVVLDKIWGKEMESVRNNCGLIKPKQFHLILSPLG